MLCTRKGHEYIYIFKRWQLCMEDQLGTGKLGERKLQSFR